jgi:outer membrane protein
MKVRYLAITLAALLLAVPAAMAQTQGQQEQSAAMKLGILDVRAAIISTAEGRQASAELQSQFAPRQSELDTLRRRIEDLQRRLREGERTLSQEEQGRLARDLNQTSRLYQRKEEDLREDAGIAEEDVVQRIGRKMMELVDRYARENGFTVILDVSAQGPVIYASNQVNITPEIIRLYDQAHPVSSAAAQPGQPQPPQPGQPRPQP